MSETGTLHFELGAFRIGRHSTTYQGRSPGDIYGTSDVPGLTSRKGGSFTGPGVNHGNDGTLVLPDHDSVVLAVADGVGKVGHGVAALREFANVFQITRDCFAACMDMNQIGRGSKDAKYRSTIAVLQLPKEPGRKGRIFSLGDSLVQRYRAEGDGLETLNVEHNAFAELIRICPGFNQIETEGNIDGEKLEAFIKKIKACIRKWFTDKRITERSAQFFIEQIRQLPRSPLEQRWDALLSFLKKLRAVVTLRLNSPVERVQARIEEVRFEIDVAAGDVFVLHSDGVNLSPEEMKEILKGTASAPEAARELVLRSTRKDSRAAVVGRVGAEPFSQKLGPRPRFDSIIPHEPHHRRE